MKLILTPENDVCSAQDVLQENNQGYKEGTKS